MCARRHERREVIYGSARGMNSYLNGCAISRDSWITLELAGAHALRWADAGSAYFALAVFIARCCSLLVRILISNTNFAPVALLLCLADGELLVAVKGAVFHCFWRMLLKFA